MDTIFKSEFVKMDSDVKNYHFPIICFYEVNIIFFYINFALTILVNDSHQRHFPCPWSGSL